MCRVYWSVVVVPIDDERSALHPDSRWGRDLATPTPEPVSRLIDKFLVVAGCKDLRCGIL